jgi:hypothetical protein
MSEDMKPRRPGKRTNKQKASRPARHPREGWAEAAKEMHRRGEDAIIDDGCWPPTDFDINEWEW